MAESNTRERELFEQALDQPTPEARLAFLRDACGADAALFARVAALLRADTAAGNFLGGACGPEQGTEGRTAEQPGDLVGRYRLGERLGEGGFGIVYRAEQLEPVRRAVALKILKPGMDSRPVVARFAAERQALARMEHPGIARVFDAGTTAAGRPYFVMELVPGMPITQFCDSARLPLCVRLELFLAVCDALQHAHQKGVIHRDLKPSNILVARPDPGGPARPKIIDFGVAKAVVPEQADAVGLTRGHELLGTPVYMSPEQAGRDGRDVDTRADLYALGVLLHELLAGRTPLDARVLAAAGLEETLRRIREEEPARPSRRLETLPADEQAEIAAARRTEPRGLRAALRGDLDWIVLRCLEKDRARRYDSAAALASDLRRHLADEPVTAAAPGLGYRFGKFVRRHRLAVGAAVAIVVALLVATAVSVALAWRATRAERTAQELFMKEQRQRLEMDVLRREADTEAATARAVTRFLNEDVLAGADPTRAPEREITLRAALDRAARRLETALTNEPAVAAALHETLGGAYQNLAQPAAAAQHFGAARELFADLRGPEHEDTLRTAIELAFARLRSGETNASVLLAEATAATAGARFGAAHPLTVRCGARLAWMYYRLGREADWHRVAEDTFQATQGAAGVEDADLLAVMYLVARRRGRQHGGVFEAGEQILLHTVQLMRERRGEDDRLTTRAKANLAVYYYDHWRQVDRAEALFREVLGRQRQMFGEDHETPVVTLGNLGLLYRRAGRVLPAQRVHLELLARRPDDPGIQRVLAGLFAAAPPVPVPLQPCRGTTNEPPGRWAASAFDDAGWSGELPPAGEAWLRTVFERDEIPIEPLVLAWEGATRAALFFNGVPVAPPAEPVVGTGRIVVASAEAMRALRPGRNVLAVHRVAPASATNTFRVALHEFPAGEEPAGSAGPSRP